MMNLGQSRNDVICRRYTDASRIVAGLREGDRAKKVEMPIEETIASGCDSASLKSFCDVVVME